MSKNHDIPPMHPASAMDFLPLAQLRDVQFIRLRDMVQRAYDHVALFRQRMDERKLKPADLRSMDDIVKLPFTVKSDLRDAYPFGLLASPLQDVVRFHASSGTTGKPIVVGYTREDIQDWTQAMVRSFAACGVHAGDVIQNAYGYGLFTGGLGAHYGAEGIGASVVPISGGNTERQIMLMKDFGVTVICCTPSYFLHLMERAVESGVNLKDLPLRTGVFGAEPWTEGMRERIEAGTAIRAYDIYGLTEIIGPGVGAECAGQNGLHIFEDHFYPEIVDPETGQPVAEGEDGELVITTLTKQAMPMLRYRSRDITAFLPGASPSGRTLRRIRRIFHRSDDMFIVRGVNVFPSQIEEVIMSTREAGNNYLIQVEKEGALDRLTVKTEVGPEIFMDDARPLNALRERIRHALQASISINPKVELVESGSLPVAEGKAKRVVDTRPRDV